MEIFVSRRLSEVVGGARGLVPQSSVVMIDSEVAGLYPKFLRDFESKFNVRKIALLSAEEGNKNFVGLERLLCEISQNDMSADPPVIVAIGGGVTLNSVGLAAALARRGLPLILLPTTLMAMADVAIGSKHAVNLAARKNYVGSFYDPAVVIIAGEFLESLSRDAAAAGLAEIWKHAIVQDYSLLAPLRSVFDVFDVNSLFTLGLRVAGLKYKLAAEDLFEEGSARALLFGHSVAHAVEMSTNFKVSHGFAVAIGVWVESFLASRLGVLEAESWVQINADFNTLFLPFVRGCFEHLNVQRLLEAIELDKRSIFKERLQCFPRRLGECGLVQNLDSSRIRLLVKSAMATLIREGGEA